MGQTGPLEPPPGTAVGGDSSPSRQTVDPTVLPGRSGSGQPADQAQVVAVVIRPVVPRTAAGRRPAIPDQRLPDRGGQAAELPAAVAGQTRPVDRALIVPVGGPSPAAAIAQAVRHAGLPPDSGFIWLLDESSRPAPDALDRLLACAALDPGAGVLGPAGVTVDRAGCRRPAPGEPMAVRDVLAVERAGALVRARAWRLLDGPNPLAGRADDLDLCWRAWRAGLRVVVVPSARLRARAPGARGAQDDHVGRADALRVRIAQSAPVGLPLSLVAVVLTAAGRVVRSLASGRVRAAGLDLLVVATALADPARLWRLSRQSAATRRVPARALRGLLPQRAKPGPPASALGGPGHDRVHHSVALARPAVLLAVLLVAAGWALRGLGTARGRPAPLPPGAAELWADVWSGWLGPAGGQLGGPGPAPPWTPLLALLSSALGGRPELAARAVLVAALALAGLAAYAATGSLGALGSLGERRWARAGLAAGYALAPPVTVAAQTGNLAAIGACAAIPVLLAAAVRVLTPPVRPGPAADWAASWWLGAALALGSACAPGMWPVAAVGLLAGAIAVGPRWAAEWGRRGGWSRLAARIAVPLLVGCAPLLPALGVAARGGRTGVLGLLVDEPARAGTDTRAFTVFALACVLAASLGGRAARGRVGVCWLLASAGWVTGQDPLAAAGLLAGVGLALTARLDAARPEPRVVPRWRARPGRRGQAAVVVLALAVAAGPAVLFTRAGGWLGTSVTPAGWSAAGLSGTTTGNASRVTGPPGGPRTLVLRPSADGTRYALTGGHGATPVDTAGDPALPARAFLAAVVADLTVGGGWGASALPALGVDEVRVPTDPGAGGPVAQGADGLLAALDADDGLARDQPRPDGYYWHLARAAGPVAESRLLAPNLAARATGGPGQRARSAGSATAARAAAAARVAVGPGAPLAGPVRAPAVTSMDVPLPAGPAGRLLVLAEPVDPGWRASLAGRPLTPASAWGWAQAFVVPAGPPGTATVRFDHMPHRALVLAEAAAVGTFLVGGLPLALATGWRRRQAAGSWAAR